MRTDIINKEPTLLQDNTGILDRKVTGAFMMRLYNGLQDLKLKHVSTPMHHFYYDGCNLDGEELLGSVAWAKIHGVSQVIIARFDTGPFDLKLQEDVNCYQVVEGKLTPEHNTIPRKVYEAKLDLKKGISSYLNHIAERFSAMLFQVSDDQTAEYLKRAILSTI